MARTPRTKGRKRARSLPSGILEHGSGFRARVTIDGKRQVSAIVPTLAEAERLRDTMLAVAAGARLLTLEAAVELLREDLREQNRRPGTLAYYDERCAVLLEAFGEDTLLANITQESVRAFAEMRRKGDADTPGAGAATIAKDLGTIRRIFRLALKRGCAGIHENPVGGLRGVPMPRYRQKRFRHLTVAEVRSIVDRIRAWPAEQQPTAQRDADLIQLLFLTGIRRAELARLRVQDVDTFRGELRIEGKTDDRTILVPEDLKPILGRLVAQARPDGFLVGPERPRRRAEAAGAAPAPKDGHDAISLVFARWKRLLRLTGTPFSPHVLRHSLATHLVDGGLPIEKLRLLLGHSRIEQTAHYYHGRDAALRDAIATAAAAFGGTKPAEAETKRSG